jgi:hypothetical protein
LHEYGRVRASVKAGFGYVLHIVQVFSIMLVAVALTPAQAHALEFPGKSRLDRDAYITVQPIYCYPGFTIAGGIGEVGGLISVIIVLLLTPRETLAFWLTLVALLGLLSMQIVFWLYTQPVNKFWLQSTTLGTLGAAFFAVGSRRQGHDDPGDWRKMRDRWEYSHIVRAGLAALSFLSLVVAPVIQELAKKTISESTLIHEADTASIAGYRYGQPDMARSPVSVGELRQIEMAVGWSEEDAAILQRHGDIFKNHSEEMVDSWHAAVLCRCRSPG